jgi:transcriptional regulator with XRE-family HTH domain
MKTPAVHQRRLGNELRRLRERAGLTGREVETAIEYSRSMLSRVETANRLIREVDLLALLKLYGVTDETERDRVVQLCRATKRRDWLVEYEDIFSPSFRDYLALEPEARLIRSYQPQFVSGLLQTEAYCRALIAANPDNQDTVDLRASVRMQRQEILRRADPPRYEAIIDESALRRPIEDRANLRGQLQHLVETASLPSVTIQILPYDATVFAGGPFSVLRLPEPGSLDAVYLENLAGETFLDDEADLRSYGVVFERLQQAALDPNASVERIIQAAEELGADD